jgi:Domain of unknown function (DUF1877)
MSCRGVHFALTDDERRALLAQAGDDERLEFVQEEIEERLFDDAPERVCETDKAWDAIHRALTDGSLDAGRGKHAPANVILGGRSLYSGDDYIMSLKTPEQVREIALFLSSVTEEALRKGYNLIDAAEYAATLDDEDFDYTWHWFQALRDFYERTATSGHHVLFTVDQ